MTKEISPNPAPAASCAFCGAPYAPRSARHAYCCDLCRYTARDRARGHLAAGSNVSAKCSDCAQPFTYVLFKKHRLRCVDCADALAHRERPEW
jgi:hypothetical protein